MYPEIRDGLIIRGVPRHNKLGHHRDVKLTVHTQTSINYERTINY